MKEKLTALLSLLFIIVSSTIIIISALNGSGKQIPRKEQIQPNINNDDGGILILPIDNDLMAIPY